MTDHHRELFARADAALDAGELDAARRHATAGLRACERLRVPALERVPGMYVLAAVHAERLEDEAARTLLARVLELDPSHGDAAYLQAKLCLTRWDFVGADRLLARWPEAEASAAVLHLRATSAELQGRQAEADGLFQRAAALDPDGCPLPVRIGDDEVHALLRETIGALPPAVVATLANLTVDVLPVPDVRLHADVDPEVLGLYAGTPVGEGDGAAIGLPDRVYIFKRNLERIAADRDELIEQLRITLLHELGHHLGWDEDDLAERGLE
ncbi:MAG: metallopeptidase family protein [Planctomycetota bacterium]